jgi:hypothetical protein
MAGRTHSMTSIEHDNDTGLAGFLAGWGKRLPENKQLTAENAVMG